VNKRQLIDKFKAAEKTIAASPDVISAIEDYRYLVIGWLEDTIPENANFETSIETVSEMATQQLVAENVPYIVYGRRMVVDPLLSMEAPRRLIGFQWGYADVYNCGFIKDPAA
jgi:hypothetical protein